MLTRGRVLVWRYHSECGISTPLAVAIIAKRAHELGDLAAFPGRSAITNGLRCNQPGRSTLTKHWNHSCMSSGFTKAITSIKWTSNNKDQRWMRDSEMNPGEGRPHHDYSMSRRTACNARKWYKMQAQHESWIDGLWLNTAWVLCGGVSLP